jgi:GxxExxY protein
MESKKVIGCAFEVQNNLGCGFLEKVYHRALASEFNNEGLKADSNKGIKISYKGKKVGLYIPDFVVEDKIIVELKGGTNDSSIRRRNQPTRLHQCPNQKKGNNSSSILSLRCSSCNF